MASCHSSSYSQVRLSLLCAITTSKVECLTAVESKGTAMTNADAELFLKNETSSINVATCAYHSIILVVVDLMLGATALFAVAYCQCVQALQPVTPPSEPQDPLWRGGRLSIHHHTLYPVLAPNSTAASSVLQYLLELLSSHHLMYLRTLLLSSIMYTPRCLMASSDSG